MDKRLFRFRLVNRIDIDTQLRTPAQFNNRKSLARVREGREKIPCFFFLQFCNLPGYILKFSS